MGEHYHNEMKGNLYQDNWFHPIVKRVLATNYKKMSFEEFKEAFDDLRAHSSTPFVWLWAAAVAYSEYGGLDKGLVLHTIKTVADYEKVIIAEFGPLFRQFPRLAYLRSLNLYSGETICEFLKFFTDPENEKFLAFWRNADNNKAPSNQGEDLERATLLEICILLDKLKLSKGEVQKIKDRISGLDEEVSS